MQEARLLIVDDEKSILHMLETILQKEDFIHIDTATNAEDALDLCNKNRYDIIILDVMLPGRSGFDICPLIRDISDAHIFFLTARSTDLDKLSGFAVGADDYITKPFNPLEVVARIKAHMRWKSGKAVPSSQKIYHFGDITVDRISGNVTVKGKNVEMPAQVYQLLLFFCKHPNQLFSKAQIYENVWGETYLGEDNTVMVHIRKLREKIEDDPSSPKLLQTVRGLGYKFVPAGGRHEIS
ncbi:response regulator transcription factor [Heyndrickxia coagulans]|uniref:response regulator transcription factor n=1 Tax=Heyndrickxia coagulans TaxID=1398 RepID=UPI0003F94892|nr:response regulator transcription factor [Heyndrickxia coagulans]